MQARISNCGSCGEIQEENTVEAPLNSKKSKTGNMSSSFKDDE